MARREAEALAEPEEDAHFDLLWARAKKLTEKQRNDLYAERSSATAKYHKAMKEEGSLTLKYNASHNENEKMEIAKKAVAKAQA